MACKRSAVRSRLAPPDLTSRIQQLSLRDRLAERVGRHRVWAGILLIAAGLLGRFTAMFRDADSLAVNLLVLVLLGFLVPSIGTLVSQRFVNRNAD